MINPERTENMQSRAYQEIIKRILRAEYVPGEKISEKSLEADLQLGRTPIREALIQLRKDGLIEVIPQSGTYITKINIKRATDARFIRQSVERKIMVEAAAKATEANVQIVMANIDAQVTAAKAKDHDKFFELDEAFHYSFYQMTAKENVWDWLQTINIQLNRFRWLRLQITKLDWSSLITDHRHLLKAVATHDPEEAERLSMNHLHLMLEEEQPLFEAFPEYFTDIQN
ncbi:GntR family transcriptional regulator [Agrilactobacillus fermenti]|uniref:GntR family transcriptional regulator n=1 Tax=Agrilactobacillus fermenti TaxID=2586909 RepID=UPI001E5D7F94|nr:GntR family transcriptional regulator [Agrilactobacillus fermenti]MCD2256038.1 GntR family transcriptional regulator [Agrilactobacillus fermenti]